MGVKLQAKTETDYLSSLFHQFLLSKLTNCYNDFFLTNIYPHNIGDHNKILS